jgi:hypothetical protein
MMGKLVKHRTKASTPLYENQCLGAQRKKCWQMISGSKGFHRRFERIWRGVVSAADSGEIRS